MPDSCGRCGNVAPRAGARIETACTLVPVSRRIVAPRAGARIETLAPDRRTGITSTPAVSPPARGRGLKRIASCSNATRASVELRRPPRGGAD